MNLNEIESGRLYGDLAWLMPLISPPSDYEEEAAHWRSVLREKLGPDRHEILELGSGGGLNLSHLTSDYNATAVDLSDAMLEECRKLNPGVPTHRGDMRTVRLGRTFAAVLIHDAISYMLDEADLSAAFATAAAHLEPGGLFVTTPDHFTETLRMPDVVHDTHDHGTIRVTYIEYTFDPDPTDTSVDALMTFLIEKDGNLQIEHDRHTWGLFPKATWIRLMEEAGFSVEMREFPLTELDRPYVLLVGTKR